MKTEIEWIDPKTTTPPFGVQFLALMGGLGSNDMLQTSKPYVRLTNVVMTRETPNCDGYEDYKDFIADTRGPAAFDDYQFCLVDFDQYKYGEPESDWYSDALIAWAPMPDFSGLLK